MAKNENTTNIAVYLDVNERLEEITNEISEGQPTKVSKLEVASQLLRAAMERETLEITTKVVSVKPRSAGSKKPAPKK